MWQKFASTSRSFWRYYVELLQYHWDHMTPMKYGMLLIAIGVAGLLLMRSNMKRC